MRVFVCNKNSDRAEAERIIGELSSISKDSIAFLREFNHSQNWKDIVENKMIESDFVLFVLGDDTFQSSNLIWEYAKAKILNKRIIGYKSLQASEDSIIYCQGYQVFSSPDDCFDFLAKAFEIDRGLKIEQYQMMFESTQKVTEQRLTVNNLFFTLTTTVFGVAFVVGKTLEFTLPGIAGMIVLTTLSFIVTVYWQKLIDSYGRLNRGKFKVIDTVERQLRTNMFEFEWKVLLNEVQYESNTETEKKIIKNFRLIILIAITCEILFFIWKIPSTRFILAYLNH